MARFERNRGMFFGSWTGKAIEATGDIDIADSTGITKAVFSASGLNDFGAAVTNSGEYVFEYDGEKWKLNEVEAKLDETYGITVTGTPKKGDIIVVDYTKASGGWEALGKDNEDLSKELNPDTETSKNVLGEVTFRHTGYQPEVSLDPYYIDPSRKMYIRIRKNAIEERYGETDLKGFFAEAFFTAANKETHTMTGYCYVREAWFVPQSTGGDTAAYGIPVTITPVGPMSEKKRIVYDMTTNEAKIEDYPAEETSKK